MSNFKIGSVLLKYILLAAIAAYAAIHAAQVLSSLEKKTCITGFFASN